ncbi:hotdog domain-containing protein [Dactylosporangium sp. NPDC051484]|uniref:thioesterase family protein n=1 Tax=Dactylosporangium sp. NPDC051484 TaxID=3154942 RepID=UPI00344CA4BC
MDDIWQAPIGETLDVPVSAALPPIPLPAGCHVEQLIWHGDPVGGAPSARVVTRDGSAATVRIALGERIIADLKVRRGPARTPRPHTLLRADVRAGAAHTKLFPITAAVTTDHVPDIEPVLSTPALIAFMEETAAAVLRPLHGPRTGSLGTWIGVRHTGPAHVGQDLTVTAVLAEVRGRRYLFDVHATVDGRPAGDGQVAQTLISLEP